jgi:hypothetical protein
MQEMEDVLDFVKFDPGPLSKKPHKDHQGYFKLLNPQFERVTAQGDGSGSKYSPLTFQFNMGPVDAKMFCDLCRANKKTAVKGLSYSSTYVFEGDRKKQADIKYETLTILEADNEPATGSRGQTVTLKIGWAKAKGKIMQYDDSGTIESSLPVDINIPEGIYTTP